jgi:hypothetical protein
MLCYAIHLRAAVPPRRESAAVAATAPARAPAAIASLVQHSWRLRLEKRLVAHEERYIRLPRYSVAWIGAARAGSVRSEAGPAVAWHTNMMLCYDMTCHAMLCYAMLCYASSCGAPHSASRVAALRRIACEEREARRAPLDPPASRLVAHLRPCCEPSASLGAMCAPHGAAARTAAAIA